MQQLSPSDKRTSARLTSLRNRPSKQPAAVSARSAATARRAAVVAARALANASCLPSASTSAAAAASGSVVLLEVSSRRSASGVLDQGLHQRCFSIVIHGALADLVCRDHDCTHTRAAPQELASVFQALAPSRPSPRRRTAPAPPSSAGRPPRVRAGGHEARGSAVLGRACAVYDEAWCAPNLERPARCDRASPPPPGRTGSPAAARPGPPAEVLQRPLPKDATRPS